MESNKNKTVISTTVSNWELYEKSLKSFPQGVKKIAIDGSKGFYGLKSLVFILKKLKSDNFDWLILVDEDVVFTKPDKTLSLINFMTVNNYTACGMRDGGTLQWRNENPHSINTFFAVINLNEVFKIFDEKEIYKNQYIIENEFYLDPDLVNFRNFTSTSLFEEYYCFFFWLLRKGRKIYYLNAENPFNNETTAVFDNQGEVFLYHAWYARFYNKDKIHTDRINLMLEKGKNIEPQTSPIVIKDNYYQFKYFFYKIYRAIVRKLR